MTAACSGDRDKARTTVAGACAVGAIAADQARQAAAERAHIDRSWRSGKNCLIKARDRTTASGNPVENHVGTKGKTKG
jgi:hypothetical protein